ncbi:hypothetical protein ACEQ8H_003990 [Pleosporales sp. CAS-2024a]
MITIYKVTPDTMSDMSEQGAKLRAAILVVSDTASKDVSSDKCIPTLKDVFDSVGNSQWVVAETSIVADDVLAIQKNMRNWTDGEEYVNLIVTSGGTGFATKDITPEIGMPQDSFALMARPVAGVRKRTLVLTLPGSPKGAKENLEAVLRLLPHACIQAAGTESRSLHVGGVEKLEKEAGVSPHGAATGNSNESSFGCLSAIEND